MWLILTSLVLSLVTIYHLWSKYKFDYWSKRGIKGPRAAFLSPFGNFMSVARKQERFTEALQNYYDLFPNEPVVGLHIGFKPLLVVKDPEYIQQILIKDFNTFENRGIPNPQNSQTIFMLTGDNWRTLRQHVRPMFSTGNIKEMVPDILKCCDDFIKFIENQKNSDHEIRSLTLRCMAAITGCLFGIDFEPFTEKTNKVVEMLEKTCISRSLLQTFIKYTLNIIFPVVDDVNKFSNKILTKLLQREASHNTKEDISSFRHSSPIGDVLKRFQDQGHLVRNFENRVHTVEVTKEILLPLISVFLITLEPAASLIALMFHELAINEEIQEITCNEIKDITEKHNGILTYEALQEMTYSQMVYKETLRKYSTVLFRVASEDFTFSNTSSTKIRIEKGTNIVIPSSAVHMDPKYFENPHGFRPERFSPENKAKIPACLFTPFGEGPRQCIAKRLTSLQALAVLATFLSRFKLEATEKTARHVKLDTSLSGRASSGSWVKISRRTTTI